MEALKLAFETVIVGALALPWLFFVLVCSSDTAAAKIKSGIGGPSLKNESDKKGIEIPSAVVDVLLFVAAYFVGVVVTRASGDFFQLIAYHDGGFYGCADLLAEASSLPFTARRHTAPTHFRPAK